MLLECCLRITVAINLYISFKNISTKIKQKDSTKACTTNITMLMLLSEGSIADYSADHINTLYMDCITQCVFFCQHKSYHHAYNIQGM